MCKRWFEVYHEGKLILNCDLDDLETFFDSLYTPDQNDKEYVVKVILDIS